MLTGCSERNGAHLSACCISFRRFHPLRRDPRDHEACDTCAFRVEAMRSCSVLVVGLLVATAAALRPPAASPGRRAAIFSAGSAVTSCLLPRPGVCRWRCCAHRCPHAGPHARALPTDADADREISALTKKIAIDEGKPSRRSQGDLAPRPLHLTRSTSLLPHTTLATALHDSAHAPPRARQAKRELQLEIRQLRSFQKYEEAELKQEERLEKELEKSAALPTTALAASTVTATLASALTTTTIIPSAVTAAISAACLTTTTLTSDRPISTSTPTSRARL